MMRMEKAHGTGPLGSRARSTREQTTSPRDSARPRIDAAPDRKGPVLAKWAVFLALALASLPSVRAQTSQPAKNADDYRTVTVKIWPQRIEKPVLQYSLLPRFYETIKGNAAVRYNAAVVAINKPLSPEDFELLDKLRTMPLAEIDAAKVEALLAERRFALRVLQDAATLDHADWETLVREKGYMVLLPKMSDLRNLVNLLAVDIRLDIKNGRWKDASTKLQTGYVLGRHLGQGDTLIESLVGIAIVSVMNKCVEDWVYQPGSPNIYWPINSIPIPFNDLRHPLNVEVDMPYLMFSQLREWKKGNYPADGVQRFVSQLNVLSDQGLIDKPWITPRLQPVAAAGWAAAEYPRAKNFLMQRGLSRVQLEQMPVAEVLGRYFVRSYEEDRDDYFRWVPLPFPQGMQVCDAAEKEFQEKVERGEFSVVAKLVFPSISRARITAARLDLQFAALGIIENLRAYAAEKHALPDSLDELPLYVPVNPMTGKPFIYQREGDVATLIAPHYKEQQKKEGYKYVIRLQRPDVIEGPIR